MRGEAFVVGGDQFLRGFDVQAFDAASQSLRGNAVDDAEVDRLGVATLIARDLVERDVEDFGGDGAVNIFVLLERFHQRRLFGEMGEDAQLDLRIVGGHQHVIGFAGDEGETDPPAFVGADRDVLQIRIGHAQSASDRAGLIEAAVDSAGFFAIDVFGEVVEIGVFQLHQAAIFEDQLGHGVFDGQAFEHFDVGAGAGLGALL